MTNKRIDKVSFIEMIGNVLNVSTKNSIVKEEPWTHNVFFYCLIFILLDWPFVLITIQFDIINFFLIYSNTILKNSMHIALTKSIFKKRSILWCYTARYTNYKVKWWNITLRCNRLENIYMIGLVRVWIVMIRQI